MRVRLVLFLASAVAAVAALGGCGSGDSGPDVANLAPAGTPLFIEATVRPEGELSEDVESLAKSVAGIDDVGGRIVEEIEESALDSGETLDFEKEVEPWLGEQVGLAFRGYDGEDFDGYAFAIETTDAGAAEGFIDQHASSEAGPASDASFDDVDYKVEKDDGQAVGMVEEMLVLAEDEATFNAVIEAAHHGDSLAGEESFRDAMEGAASGSLANVFVDIGLLIESSGDAIDPDAQQFLDLAGIEPRQATAVASLVPGSDQVEIEFSTNALGESPSTGDVSELLGEMPGGAVAAAAAPAVGDRLGEAIDSLDESGIPGEVPPNQFKKTLKAVGVDLDRITASIGDVALFVEGNTERNLTGALVIQTTGEREATNTVANVGLFLRQAQVAGVTALSGKATGFSVRSDDLGQPIVVAAEGDRIAISYGLAASALALRAGEGSTLSADPRYKEAVAALGDTPISAFVAGPAALALARDMLSEDDLEDLEELRPFLDKVSFLGAGTGSSGDRTTAKLIVGFEK